MRVKRQNARRQDKPKTTLDKPQGLGRPQTPPPQPKDYEDIEY